MKTIIDRDLTTLAKLQLVKDHVTDFKAIFTEKDLLRMHNEEWDEDIHGDILKCTVTAFPATGFTEDKNIIYRVEMIIDTVLSFAKISYYIDEIDGGFSISHDDDDILHTIEKYRLAI